MSESGEAGASSLPDLYFDPYFEMEAVKLLPGEYYVTARDMLLVTVLGSCVCACIRDPQQGIGGMTHFMLPDAYRDQEQQQRSVRYGSHAMEVLINELLKMGAERKRLEAKVFGAGNVLSRPGSHVIGERNSRFLVNYLQRESIPVVGQDLLDSFPRKVYFFPHSGRVLVKKLKRLNNTTIFEREADYFQRLTDTEITGNVELFS
ncbi:chemoreceptor glutamine deamidase CheD [Nitrincola tapanii]|uniref:Probable chemoreceptor glutamine deamidase CheD n=1 Tax=Nitrincola tapanii TaxID=1708751 RepID=A0A5A9W6B4_9GAMM|nr:chemoreceptor glutamine deamidase CheD [Nitrincola tapanii]KAA0875668.1 chemoreceptor glutamine deamidase CheD [Nitrincola tapanii]